MNAAAAAAPAAAAVVVLSASGLTGAVVLLLWYSAAVPSVVSVRKPTRRPSLKTRHYRRLSVSRSLSLSLCLARWPAVKSDGISAAAAAAAGSR